MNNKKLHWLIGEQREGRRPKWTVAKIAAAIYSGRAHVTQVLNNEPGRGGQTRAKLIKFFRKEFPETSEQILESLGWVRAGLAIVPVGPSVEKVPGGTFHVEQPATKSIK
jgi:hypothetical protein